MFTLNQRFTLLIRSTLLLILFAFSNTVAAALIQNITLIPNGPVIGTVQLPSEMGSVNDCDLDITACPGFQFSFQFTAAGLTFDETNVGSAAWEIDDQWQLTAFELFASNENSDVNGCTSSEDCLLSLDINQFVLDTPGLSGRGNVYYQPVHTIPEPTNLLLLSIGLIGFGLMQGRTRRLQIIKLAT